MSSLNWSAKRRCPRSCSPQSKTYSSARLLFQRTVSTQYSLKTSFLWSATLWTRPLPKLALLLPKEGSLIKLNLILWVSSSKCRILTSTKLCASLQPQTDQKNRFSLKTLKSSFTRCLHLQGSKKSSLSTTMPQCKWIYLSTSFCSKQKPHNLASYGFASRRALSSPTLWCLFQTKPS